MFEKIKEAYRRYNNRIIRRAFDEEVSRGYYGEAIRLAEHNCKRNGWSLSKGDLDDIRAGIREHMIRLKNLEVYVK